MKKFFYFAVLLLGVVACNNEEIDNLELEVIDPATEISNMISEMDDYDVNLVDQILCGKHWVMDFFCEYFEEWNEIRFDSRYDKCIGYAVWSYVFHADGRLEDFTDSEATPEVIEYEVRSWAFDPETRTLTIDGVKNYHLIALGEETFIWDRVSTGTGYPRYFREVFKARAVE